MLPKRPSQLLCWLFLTTVLALPGFGQGRDTVFAVHKLFREKRGGGGGYSAASDTAFSHKRYAQRADGLPTAQEARMDVLAGTAFAAVGVAKAGRYSPEREAYVIEAYHLGNPIPTDIRRKLRRKHFRLTDRDVTGPRPLILLR